MYEIINFETKNGCVSYSHGLLSLAADIKNPDISQKIISGLNALDKYEKKVPKYSSEIIVNGLRKLYHIVILAPDISDAVKDSMCPIITRSRMETTLASLEKMYEEFKKYIDSPSVDGFPQYFRLCIELIRQQENWKALQPLGVFLLHDYIESIDPTKWSRYKKYDSIDVIQLSNCRRDTKYHLLQFNINCAVVAGGLGHLVFMC